MKSHKTQVNREIHQYSQRSMASDFIQHNLTHTFMTQQCRVKRVDWIEKKSFLNNINPNLGQICETHMRKQ